MDSDGLIESVNVGGRRIVEWEGREVETGIWKEPVVGRIGVEGVNLEGDDQADRRVHGGPDKAIYAYAIEDYRFWGSELGGVEVGPGVFGENLTVSGLDLGMAQVGERWEVGTTVLEVRQPRLPCFKLGIRMGDSSFPDRFDHEERLGVYLSIVREGELGAGDPITVTHRPSHGLTAYAIAQAYPHPTASELELILSVERIPDGWRKWAFRARDRSGLA